MLVPPLEWRVLSVRQPWAWLICYGPKPVENRTWSTKYRGQLLIHASLEIDLEAVAALRLRDVYLPREYVTGSIVGRAQLIDCVDQHASPWFVGPWGLVLDQRRGLPVFKCRGKLGLWRPTPEIMAFYEGRL
ncbi:MAG: ASCH domain-containing protein [Burkholderiales bacterium]|nr:ASCH domain-containing protein [Burkholderiales bacterium]